MNPISLLGMDLGGVLLNVLAIIGIIIAGGFLIFFLGDLLLSILDPKNNSLSDRQRQQNFEQYNEPQKLQEPVRPQELTYIPTQTIYEQPTKSFDTSMPVYEQPKPAQETRHGYNDVDLSKALEEERMLFALGKETESQKTEHLEEIKEDTPTLDIFEALKKEEEAYKAEKIASQSTNVFGKVEPVKENQNEDEFNFDDLFFTDDEKETVKEEDKESDFEFDFEFDFEDEEDAENLEEQKKEVEEVEVEEVEVAFEEDLEDIFEEIEKIEESEEAETVEEIEEKQADNQALKDLQAENEKLKEEIEELARLQEEKRKALEEERRALEEFKANAKTEGGPLLTEEEYNARLEELTARLKYNEKELRAIKREYVPLRRVRTTLERDKKKLRRKEALVAKQKILLYGVNNMSDIDEEKAKKLEEDLDLLDGLRLSVQHCEEVIRNSEERYPILETSFNILTKTIEQIKGDIQRVEDSLAKIKENK